MRIISIALIFFSLLCMLPDQSLAQPCPPVCDNCLDECATSCMNSVCQTCLQTPADLGGCLGAEIPISDHAGFLLAGGLILISVYYIRQRRLVSNINSKLIGSKMK